MNRVLSGPSAAAGSMLAAIHASRDPESRAALAEALALAHPLAAADILSVSADPVVISALTGVFYERLRTGPPASASLDRRVESSVSAALARRLQHHRLLPGLVPLPAEVRVRLARFLPHAQLLYFLLSRPECGGAGPGEGALLAASLRNEPFSAEIADVLVSWERVEHTVTLWFLSAAAPGDGVNRQELIGFLHATIPTLPSRALHADALALDTTHPSVASTVQEALESFPTGCRFPGCAEPRFRAARTALLFQIAENSLAPLAASIAATHALICLDDRR